MSKKILLLGSGELGKEFTISAQRLGCTVIAADRYSGAPAMQVADQHEVFSMLDGDKLAEVVTRHQPDLIVPEIEAIRTEKLQEFEARGIQVVPTAEATFLTMNREAIRNLAATELGLRTARFAYAESLEELLQASETVGFPCVIKPIMSSSGKGQSTAKTADDLKSSWTHAVEGMRGDQQRVIIEEFIEFDLEITLLTVKQKNAETIFVEPIGHRQEGGDYRESWLPAAMPPALLDKAKQMARMVTDRMGGAGLFGVEFFITKDDVVFSELSPRPHDTGMVTLISQNLTEFDLHVRAILGLPIPAIHTYGPSASAVVLADRESKNFSISGIAEAMQADLTDVRIFGKPDTRKNRRMAVALARAETTDDARRKAVAAANCIKIEYND